MSGAMRKLGLYVQVQADPGIRAKLQRLRPAVVLVHLDGGDLVQWINAELPDTFVVGRRYWTEAEQEAALARSGAVLAQMVLGVPGAAGCDAFMLFNEFIGSPVDHGTEAEFTARAQRLDELQVEFRAALKSQGYEAVAFNFAAGNWPNIDVYRKHFPKTMWAYKYFGFHVYGWPKLAGAGWRSNLDETLAIMDKVECAIITEMAVTRAYGQAGPDVGWLSGPDPMSLDTYAADLAAVEAELCKRPNVIGACLFNAAPDARWQTFAVTPELVERLARLPECGKDQPQSDAEGQSSTTAAKRIQLRLPFAGTYKLTQAWGANPETYARYGLKGHEGVDWALPLGTPVLACAAGTVSQVDEIAGEATKDPYGIYVRIQHDGFETVYAHLTRATVRKGDVLKAGDQVGLSGMTGNSTGPHLHLSFRLAGANQKDGYLGYSDPMPYMLGESTVTPAPETSAKALLAQAAALLARAQELLA